MIFFLSTYKLLKDNLKSPTMIPVYDDYLIFLQDVSIQITCRNALLIACFSHF